MRKPLIYCFFFCFVLNHFSPSYYNRWLRRIPTYINYLWDTFELLSNRKLKYYNSNVKRIKVVINIYVCQKRLRLRWIIKITTRIFRFQVKSYKTMTPEENTRSKHNFYTKRLALSTIHDVPKETRRELSRNVLRRFGQVLAEKPNTDVVDEHLTDRWRTRTEWSRRDNGARSRRRRRHP